MTFDQYKIKETKRIDREYQKLKKELYASFGGGLKGWLGRRLIDTILFSLYIALFLHALSSIKNDHKK